MSKVKYVLTYKHPDPFTTIVERYEPANDGDDAVALFGEWPNFTSMRFVSREIIQRKH
jgi:hypothetical protein